MYAQIKHSLAHLQDLIPTLAYIKYSYMQNTPAKVGIKSCGCARECFIVHAIGFEL